MTYGGPYYATTLAPLMVYELAFDLFDLGLAAAFLTVMVGLTILLIVGVVSLLGERSGRPTL